MNKQLEEFQKLNVGDVISVKGQEFAVTGLPYCDTHFASWENNGWKVNTTGGVISYYDDISIVSRSTDMQLRRGNLEDFQTLKAGHIISAEGVGERLLVLGEPYLTDFQGLIVPTDGGAVSVNDNIRVIGFVKPEVEYHLNPQKMFERLPKDVQEIYRDYRMLQEKIKWEELYDPHHFGVKQMVSAEHMEVVKKFINAGDGYVFVHLKEDVPIEKVFAEERLHDEKLIQRMEHTKVEINGEEYTFEDFNWDSLLENPQILSQISFHRYEDYGCIFMEFEERDNGCVVSFDCPYENANWYAHLKEDFENEIYGFHDVVDGINFMCSQYEEKYRTYPFEDKVYTGKYKSDLFGKIDVTVMMPFGCIELSGDIEALPEDSEFRTAYDELDTESILSCDGIHTDFYIDDPDVQNYMIHECRKLVSGFVDDYYASCFENEKETNKEEEDYER